MDGPYPVGALLLAPASAPLWSVNAIRRRRTLEPGILTGLGLLAGMVDDRRFLGAP